jgi:hypothetical protein
MMSESMVAVVVSCEKENKEVLSDIAIKKLLIQIDGEDVAFFILKQR